MTTWKRSSRLDNTTTIQREDGTKLFRLAGATDQELALAVAAPKLLEYALLEREIDAFDCSHDFEARCKCGTRFGEMCERAKQMREAVITEAESSS